MIITAIAYANEAQTALKVTTSDEGVMNSIPNLEANDPNRTWHNGVVDAWLVDHTISAWVEPVDYMAKMRAERDQRLAAIDWRITRNYTQVAHSETPTDDASKMTAIYQYQKDLRDMPEDNPNTTTAALYAALVWPEEPA